MREALAPRRKGWPHEDIQEPSNHTYPPTEEKHLNLISKDFKRKSSQNNKISLKMSKILTISLVVCSLLNCLPPASGAKGEKRVVCYYTNWSAYRQGPAKFLPDNINPYLCTHLVYAFGGLTTDSGIKPFDKYQDIDKGGYTKFNGLKTYNKALKTLIAIGGWNEGSRRFSNLVADAESRKTFIKHAIRFLRQYQFDGLDLDWEYPASREGGVPEDKKNYAQFIKELREAFEDESKSTGRARLLLTVAVPAGIEWIQKGFDIPIINRNIDFFNLLTYDYHASTEPNANHHAPLKARDGLSEYDWKGQLNIEFTINHYLKEGADPDKLVVGLPTYGRSYNLFNTESYDIDAPSSGPGTKGKFTKEPGYLAYYEICEGIKAGEWRVENGESDSQGPHAVKHDQWVGYDDTRMMAIKSKWVKDNGLGGIMFWSVDNDDFRGACHGKPFPLIEAAKLAYLTGDAPRSQSSSSTKSNRPSPIKNNRFSTINNRRTTTPSPPPTSTGAPSKPRRNKNRNKNRRNKNKKGSTTTTEATTTSTTTRPTTTSNPLSTPEPPVTPDPGVDFECKDDGFFPHPRECKKYFWCLEAPGLGIVAHHFTCPAGLFFNKNTDSCDYARNVPCKDKKAGAVEIVTPAPTTTTTTTTTTRAPITTRTTTTTTEAPEEEEYDDEEEYEDEEEEPQSTKGEKVSSDDNGRSVKQINDVRDLLKLIKKFGGVEELEKYLNENPSVAAALEEYEEEEEEKSGGKVKTSTASSLFNRNRFTPSASSSTSLNTRPRFGGTNTNPVAAGSLKYTSIQRNRPSTTTTEKSFNSAEESDDDDDDSNVPKKNAKSTLFSSSRPKYVTLSRNSKQTDSNSNDNTKIVESVEKKAIPSSTETSIVVRFSGDDEKLIDEINNNTDIDPDEILDNDEETDDVVAGGDDNTKETKDRYVTISRPYAKVSSPSGEDDPIYYKTPTTTPKPRSNSKFKARHVQSSSSARTNNLRYVQLSRGKTTDSGKTEQVAQETKKKTIEQEKEEIEEEQKSSEEKDDENYDSEEEQSIVEQGEVTNTPSISSTTTQQTTTTESPVTTKPSRLRIPTRKTNGFASRTRGTTTGTTRPTRGSTSTTNSQNSNSESTGGEEGQKKAKNSSNFAVGNRRNLFLSRNRSTSTSTALPVLDTTSSQSNNDESITELISRAADGISRRLDENQNLDQSASDRQDSTQTQSQGQSQRSTRTRSNTRSITSTPKSNANTISSLDKDNRGDINAISRLRSKSRYRSTTTTTEQSTSSQTVTPVPIVFRRRHKSSTSAPLVSTTAPTTIAPTTKTTKRPTSTTATLGITRNTPIILKQGSIASNLVPSTNTKSTVKPTTDEDEEAEYYYYYYDTDDEEPTQKPTGPKDTTDLLQKSQTQRTTGLRTQDFSPATVQIVQSAPQGVDRGFTKRNLQTSTQQVKQPRSFIIENTNSNLNLNTNSFNPGLSHHKWSDRAVVPLSEKIRLSLDGTVECLDKGIFPHPISCKQFVHCVPSEENDGSLRAWVYACPKLLTFDPIGGMCNYDEFAYSKRAPSGNACIE